MFEKDGRVYISEEEYLRELPAHLEERRQRRKKLLQTVIILLMIAALLALCWYKLRVFFDHFGAAIM